MVFSSEIIPDTRTLDVIRNEELNKCRDDIIYFADVYYRHSGNKIMLTPDQITTLRNLMKGHRNVIAGECGSGKSTVLRIFAAWKLCTAKLGLTLVFFGSTGQKGKDAVKEIVNSISKERNIMPKFVKTDRSMMTLTYRFSNRTVLIGRSSSAKSLRGSQFDFVIFDDLIWSKGAYDAIHYFIPVFAANQGMGIIISSASPIEPRPKYQSEEVSEFMRTSEEGTSIYTYNKLKNIIENPVITYIKRLDKRTRNEQGKFVIEE